MAFTQVTLAELRAMLTQRWEGVPWWTTVDANRALNEALKVWNIATGFWRDDSPAELVPNDPWVPFTAPIVMGTRILYNNIPLAKTSLFDLDQAKPDWRQATGTPWAWAPVSLRLAVVYPAVTAFDTFIQVEGLMKTPVLAADGDFVNLGQEELNAILSYALHAAAYKTGGELLAETEPHRMAFWHAAARRNQQLKRSIPLRLSTGRSDQWQQPTHHPTAVTSGDDDA